MAWLTRAQVLESDRILSVLYANHVMRQVDLSLWSSVSSSMKWEELDSLSHGVYFVVAL